MRATIWAGSRLSSHLLAHRQVHPHDLTLVTSPQIKAEFEEQGIERIEVWRKEIDTVSFKPRWKNTATYNMLSDGNPNDILMVYIGRLGREKHIEELHAVLDQNPNIHLVIVGGGHYTDTLREGFEGSKTVFIGILRGQPLWEAFASSNVFCMPSDSETLGFVVLDSLASGVPVIGLHFCVFISCSLALLHTLLTSFVSVSLSRSRACARVLVLSLMFTLSVSGSRARAHSLSLAIPRPLPVSLPLARSLALSLPASLPPSPSSSPSHPPPSLSLSLSLSISICLSLYVLREVGHYREIRLLKYKN